MVQTDSRGRSPTLRRSCWHGFRCAFGLQNLLQLEAPVQVGLHLGVGVHERTANAYCFLNVLQATVEPPSAPTVVG